MRATIYCHSKLPQEYTGTLDVSVCCRVCSIANCCVDIVLLWFGMKCAIVCVRLVGESLDKALDCLVGSLLWVPINFDLVSLGLFLLGVSFHFSTGCSSLLLVFVVATMLLLLLFSCIFRCDVIFLLYELLLFCLLLLLLFYYIC